MAPILVAILCLYQSIAILPVVAGDYFPGKGSRQVWKQATLVCVEADHLESESKFPEAIAKYKAAIAMYPYDADYYTNLGEAYRKREKQGDSLLAEANYRKAIILKPNSWNPWYGLADVLFDQKRKTEARAALVRAMNLNPPTDVLRVMRKNMQELDRDLASAAKP